MSELFKRNKFHPTTDFTLEDLRPGAWVSFIYGIEANIYYIESVDPYTIQFGSKDWCASAYLTVSHDEVLEGTLLGYGKRRWWWYILPWRDVVCKWSSV